jgi:hypothetical protein
LARLSKSVTFESNKGYEFFAGIFRRRDWMRYEISDRPGFSKNDFFSTVGNFFFECERLHYIRHNYLAHPGKKLHGAKLKAPSINGPVWRFEHFLEFWLRNISFTKAAHAFLCFSEYYS